MLQVLDACTHHDRGVSDLSQLCQLLMEVVKKVDVDCQNVQLLLETELLTFSELFVSEVTLLDSIRCWQLYVGCPQTVKGLWQGAQPVWML